MKINITHNDIMNMVAEVFTRLDNRSMLSEITAQDAYARFYQGKIPEKVFQKLMLGSDQMTPLHKLALDHLVKVYSEQKPTRMPKIVGIISKFWNSANNESRQYAIKVCKDEGDRLKDNLGFFENVVTELANMKSHSESSYIERGFEVLFENDVLRITCTKSYSSSCRHYGKSHWCTASDQFGEYDGFNMFRRYTISNKSILVQFVPKEAPEKTCQAQFEDKKRMTLGQICDWQDCSVTERQLSEILEKCCSISLAVAYLKFIGPKIDRLYKETVEIGQDEKIYYVRKKAERLKTMAKKFTNSLNSADCENFAKKVFAEGKRGSIHSEDNVWRAFRLAGCVNPNFVNVTYEGKTQAEIDFIERYYDDEDYYIDEYGVINTNIVFLFDNNGNIIGKYVGHLSLCNKFFTFITDRYSDELYSCTANYVIRTDNGQVLFKNVIPCSTDECDSYFDDIGDEELRTLFNDNFTYGDWFAVADANNNAYALSSRTGEIVKVPYNGYYF